MLIKSHDPTQASESEVTPEGWHLRRRELIRVALTATAAIATGGWAPGCSRGDEPASTAKESPPARTYDNLKRSSFSTDETANRFEDVSSYNNFYEFGTDKTDPARHAHTLVTRPWRVRIGGEVAKPGELDLDDLLRPHPLEERIYRLRCVEAWSVVVPWVGFPLGDLLKRFEPTSRAKFVAFTTLLRPEQMIGQTSRSLPWPYREGLRIDEAMHPLTILAVGMYGRELPNQNGAPLRLVVPWKYGFKSIKSIVAIDLVESQPATTWNEVGPEEYGFYSNVNPDVDHPRWSQKRERRIGELLKRPTLPFNGYGEQVAQLYAGMDLHKYY